MFFNSKNNTDINNEFSDNNFTNKVLSFIFKYKLFIFIILIPLIIGILVNNNDNYEIVLSGEEMITLYIGSEYIEPGYKAIDGSGENLTNKVKTETNLDMNKIGQYEIIYKIGNITKTRTINIVNKSEEYIYIYLTSVNNSKTVYLKRGEEYKEPGYRAFSTSGENLTSQVEVIGNIDTSKTGTYKLTYSVIDSNGVTTSETRNIIVMDTDINLTTNTNEYTNKDIIINIEVVDNYFDYIILPNNQKITSSSYQYKVSQNGKYTFKVYNKKGNIKEESIEINNIDKEEPNGDCNGFYKDNKTTININANDNIGIGKYIIDNIEDITDKERYIKVLNKKLDNISIIIYDKANNSKTISCDIEDKSFLEVIKPNDNENIIKNGETDSLKVYISKKNNYYITRIWAKNPYLQLNKKDSPEYGSSLYRPSDLLKMEINNKDLNNKLIIGFNASGFYLRDTYDADSVNKYSNYNKTSVGTLVITDGKVIRNAYDKSYKTWYVTGIDDNNVLRIFTDSIANGDNEVLQKKKWSQDVINSKIRNTFTFAHHL